MSTCASEEKERGIMIIRIIRKKRNIVLVFAPHTNANPNININA